jgi:hypothetical protein
VTAALLAVSACSGGSQEDLGSADDGSETSSTPADPADATQRELRFDGPDDGAFVNAEDLDSLALAVTASDGSVDDLRFVHDGREVTDHLEVEELTATYVPRSLEDGEHTVEVVVDADTLHTWRFEVKAEPPPLEVTSPDGPLIGDDVVTVAGTTEPGAVVDVAGERATADDAGDFEVELAEVEGDLTIVATDVAGNVTEVVHPVAIVASRVEVEEIRTVHATFWAWATPSLRDPILQMIDDGKINAVQLDLKDESGQVGYASQLPLVQEVGADVGPLDLEQAVADLHERDVAVIGRIVAFADPLLASWAWDNDRRDWVIQLPDGSDYFRGAYAGFSNYGHEGVIAYNLDIAEEAAQAGVDHILWDYIRRPEGRDSYTVPGLEMSPEEAIVDFTRQADERLAPYGIQHGASVYGIAADRPEQIGQDIPAMAEHLDYVAPMIYPSHWGVGEYGVADPNRQPYDIVRATLEVWDEATEGRRARVVPWLEDTPYRAWDRPFQIREQIRATQDHGIDEWLMWNPGSRFTPEAYDRRD